MKSRSRSDQTRFELHYIYTGNEIFEKGLRMDVRDYYALFLGMVPSKLVTAVRSPGTSSPQRPERELTTLHRLDETRGNYIPGTYLLLCNPLSMWVSRNYCTRWGPGSSAIINKVTIAGCKMVAKVVKFQVKTALPSFCMAPIRVQ